MGRSLQVSKQRELALSETPEIVRFEQNLLRIGFFSAAPPPRNGATPTVRRIEQLVRRDNKLVKIAAEFRGSGLGLPRTPDRDKFLAFMQIVVELKMRQGPLSNPIRFPGAEMLKRLGLTDAGKNYEELAIWGKRMADTTITSEEAVYFASKRKFENDTFHVFRRFTVQGVGDNKTGGQTSVWYAVSVEDWLLDNINKAYYVPEDFYLYKKLVRPIAKGIYNYLNLWFNASDGESVEKDYRDLCILLDVKCYNTESKIREQLNPSMDDLIGIEYLSGWTVKKMVTKDGWKLVMEPGAALMKFIRAHQRKYMLPSASATELLTTEQEILREKLFQYGVDEAKCLSLVRKFDPAETTVQMEYAVEQAKQPGSRIRNLAGYVISFIEAGKKVPSSFEPNSVRLLRQDAAQKQRDLEERRQEEEHLATLAENEYREWRISEATKLIRATFDEHALAEKLRAVEKEIISKMSQPELWRKQSVAVRRESLVRALAQQVAAEQNLSMDQYLDWKASDVQPSLFPQLAERL
jgi:hypothetical protein